MSSKIRTALFGGSFDPIHIGHTSLATEVLRQNLADEVWFMVSPRNPLKKDSNLTDENQRLEMVRLAVVGEPRFVACDFEFNLPRPSYTFHTLQALEAAVADLKEGAIDAMVTAPIDKEMAQSEAFRFTGHTEFMAAHLEGEPMMIMCSERLRVGLVTIHIPVAEVSQSISKEKIVAALATLRQTLKEDFGIVEPRIAVLSLNPHAGEGGLLGEEEQTIIKPAIEEAFAEGVLAFGPFPSDGLFGGGGYVKYDAVLAMYHDQGLIPFKTLSPEGVNFTAGLSAVRTSPDHGTAYDIAGKGVADAQSMRNAIYAAMDIVRNREQWAEWTANPLQHFERDKGRDVSVKDLKLPETEE